MTSLIEVHTDEQIGQVAGLAHRIWNEHFPKIIGQTQVDYMLDRFQSIAAIQHQIQKGYQYYLIHTGALKVGYIALLQRPEHHSLQISKLYLLSDWRGKGLARIMLARVSDMASGQGYNKLYLTVNKYNHAALAAYRKLGFVRQGEVVADIGNGFFMDDYEMTLDIASPSRK